MIKPIVMHRTIVICILAVAIFYATNTFISNVYGQTPTRYTLECGIAPNLDIDLLKGFMVMQFGGTNTNTWEDREAAEKFDCIEAIEYQERYGINKPVN